ncbi:MAG TPA: NAD-dependent epimerase/dehydratase family protein [Gammaproteobacteria bacterium]|nr:NAD-dependent epimerase/dehydratase family protein [Gammaproteobacteria bacterium]
MSGKLRVALFGAGKMGLHHVKAIELQRDADLVAVADPGMGRNGIGDQLPPSVERFSDAAELLEKVRPDVVHIVTPPHTHVELAKQALQAGAHVYVEKPFSLHLAEAEEVVRLAGEKGLKVCPAHQVLFQDAGRRYRKYLPLIKEVVQVESYFSFKTVRHSPDGKGAITPIDQLLDILPHPVYLMLSAFEENGRAAELEMKAVEVDADGEVHAIFKAGQRTGLLIVTLRGRPIESYLKINGTNGQILADFILTGVQKFPGPGASAISLVYMPFSKAFQLMWGTVSTIFRMVFRKHKSYAGLAELVEEFYESIRTGAQPPVPTGSLLDTVRICENIGERLKAADAEREQRDLATLAEKEATLEPPVAGRKHVLVTGGTGFLGQELVRELRERGWPVRVIARRMPPARKRVPGVEYVEGDISEALPDEFFHDVGTIAHLAAETAGGQDAHQRNTIDATRNLLEAAARHGIGQFINISSIAVLKPSAEVGGPLSEHSPVDIDNIGRGPYVWGKAAAERLVEQAAEAGEVSARTIRLGPLVDFRDFTPPGRLGREVGPLFVAMGNPWDKLSVCDVRTASNVIRYYVEHFDEAPVLLNLVEADAPSRSDLAKLNKQVRPELTNFWLFSPLLKLISWTLIGVQKLLKPGRKPLDIHAAFASEQYDTTLAGEVIRKARQD